MLSWGLSARNRISILCVISRVTFASVLLPWFLIGGLSKIAGLALSVGPAVGNLSLTLGAYFVYAPWQVISLNEGLPTPAYPVQIYVALMVFLEIALPVLIVIGWKARIATVALALHQIISVVLLQSSGNFGALFDASPFDIVPDQLLLWVYLLVPLALFGAGPLSMDSAWRRISAKRSRRQSTL